MESSAKKMSIDTNGKYTYADYLTWPDDERWELIEGTPYDMSPAPNRKHQAIQMHMGSTLWMYLKKKPCRIYSAPFDVRLIDKPFISDEEVTSIVQPDLVVFCDQEKLDDKGAVGAPDLAVEILSPSTAYKDQNQKFQLYRKHGVKEYWVVIPEAEQILVYRLEDGDFAKPVCYKEGDALTSPLFPEFSLDVGEVFSAQ